MHSVDIIAATIAHVFSSKINSTKLVLLFHDERLCHIETSPLICSEHKEHF